MTNDNNSITIKNYITMSTYNGWTNYATWRVKLDILADIKFNRKVTADDLEKIVEDCVFRDSDAYYLVEDYARYFLSDVNYEEIAEAINE